MLAWQLHLPMPGKWGDRGPNAEQSLPRPVTIWITIVQRLPPIAVTRLSSGSTLMLQESWILFEQSSLLFKKIATAFGRAYHHISAPQTMERFLPIRVLTLAPLHILEQREATSCICYCLCRK